ncbi:URC4/urg3 family protein [Vineibacter terrae]|uniref:URC4/urg3 family protein n=1 Tax=Vineibacter terrae TaxID=2586908 RepID=UPI002E3342F3|nr:URC4/urg3 family protein [Vineibacter terrae]HEX2887036.1 URC4/urg3 family protein [Vineibacter terrae]
MTQPSLGTPAEAIAYLRTPDAIRERARAVWRRVENGESPHFALDYDGIEAAVRATLAVMRERFPDPRAVPFHARWRHFEAGGRDRWRPLAQRLPAGMPREERARRRFDLAIVSVLLDAGAGPDWRYRELASGQTLARSEGLAVASLDMFAAGAFSAHRGDPLRADAEALMRLEELALVAGFQVAAHNPLVGLDGRTRLLRRLGDAVLARPDLFGGRDPRPGHLFDHLASQVSGQTLPAPAILAALLEAFTPIWPSRLDIAGQSLGDVWRHPAAAARDLTDGLVPFHKLSQWLAYSLVEPLEEAGIAVTDLDSLTGLPEYRNGGLFIDSGALRVKRRDILERAWTPGDEVIVEWRAMTVLLLDQVAQHVRAHLGLDAATLPLAKVLEGGTWLAGRRLASQSRIAGTPPITIDSDGTVF